ncbi:hypothetical protein EV126DRAFT_426232 [Verticillium dahliae]|nr:hypothetical protein EV126DRAFT_426232 [Verticillium dahliae]
MGKTRRRNSARTTRPTTRRPSSERTKPHRLSEGLGKKVDGLSRGPLVQCIVPHGRGVRCDKHSMFITHRTGGKTRAATGPHGGGKGGATDEPMAKAVGQCTQAAAGHLGTTTPLALPEQGGRGVCPRPESGDSTGDTCEGWMSGGQGAVSILGGSRMRDESVSIQCQAQANVQPRRECWLGSCPKKRSYGGQYSRKDCWVCTKRMRPALWRVVC